MATAARTHRATAAPRKVLGLELTREEAHQLKQGKALSLKQRSLGEMANFLQEVHKELAAAGKSLTWGEFLSYSGSGRCPGIKLISFDDNDNCGLYLHPSKGLEECCKKESN